MPKNIFAPVTKPGSIYGYLSDEICEELGCDKVPVIAVASHDTASAVAATPTTKMTLFILAVALGAFLVLKAKHLI